MAGDPPARRFLPSAGDQPFLRLPPPARPPWRTPVSSNTLHEFVLGLLSDPTALADFQNDAEGALGAAGLGDISALDVQEVLPLGLDYMTAGSLPALHGSVLEDLPLDVDVDGPAAAINQLHAVTQLVGVPSTTDVNLAA